MYVYICVYVGGGSSQQSVLFYHMKPRDSNQVMRLDSQHLYPLNHFNGSSSSEEHRNFKYRK